jgi:enoyl-CoA hydratase
LFTEIIRYAIGTPLAAKATLTGKTYGSKEALELGIVDALVPETDLLSEAISIAKSIAPDCLTAYAFSKRALQEPVLKSIEETERLDAGFGKAWCSGGAQSATARKYRQLKGRPIPKHPLAADNRSGSNA